MRDPAVERPTPWRTVREPGPRWLAPAPRAHAGIADHRSRGRKAAASLRHWSEAPFGRRRPAAERRSDTCRSRTGRPARELPACRRLRPPPRFPAHCWAQAVRRASSRTTMRCSASSAWRGDNRWKSALPSGQFQPTTSCRVCISIRSWVTNFNDSQYMPSRTKGNCLGRGQRRVA